MFYQMGFEHEVWGNYMCCLKFLNQNNKVAYSRNVLYHNLLWSNYTFPYFLPLTPNYLLVYEYKRPDLSELVILDFTELVAYRKALENNFDPRMFFAQSKKRIVETSKDSFQQFPFCEERIHLPFLKFWGKKKEIVW